MKRLLLSGACGFVGSHIVDAVMKETDWEVVGLDRLSYAGRLDRLSQWRNSSRLQFVFHDFRGRFRESLLGQLGHIDYLVHNGAATHVDRSLIEPWEFVEANVQGTFHVLEAAMQLGVSKFLYTSTDEVFGPAPEGVSYKEDDPLKPSNPYSASKAAGEAFAYSYFKSFHLPVVVTRSMNIFGEKQHPEKFVPLVMRKLLLGECVKIHASPEGLVGSRNWLHARNQADAILFLLQRGVPGETYHVAGVERSNLEIAEILAGIMDRQLKYELVDAVSHRPGHDLRYALSDEKIRLMGWTPPVEFEASLEKTVEWTMERRVWLDL